MLNAERTPDLSYTKAETGREMAGVQAGAQTACPAVSGVCHRTQQVTGEKTRGAGLLRSHAFLVRLTTHLPAAAQSTWSLTDGCTAG